MNTADCNIRTNATVVSPEQIMNEILGLKTVGLIVRSNMHHFILQITKINPHHLDPSWPAFPAQGFVFGWTG